MKKLSIVVPCYREKDNIRDSYNLLKEVVKQLPDYDYEIIFADNNSEDGSEEILRDIASKDEKFKVILNNRNFGPECNTINAFYSACSDAVILVMCDRQDPYELIPEFVKKWEDGAKVVWGQKTSSKESWLMYKVRSLYYKIIKAFSSIPQYEHVIGYGLYDKDVIKEIKETNDPNPILRNIIPNLGYKPELIPYKQQARTKGKTAYNFFSYFDTALNSLIHASKAPMKIMIYLGLLSGLLSFLVGIIYFLFKLLYWDTFSAGMAPIIIMFSFIASIQIFFLGIIGEYLLYVLDRVSFNKNVIEKERINFK